MAGPLSSTRPSGDANLTGTGGSSEFSNDARAVRRSTHMERPVRLGSFAVDGRPPTAKGFNQKSPTATSLRSKAEFKPRRKRK